MFAKIQRIHFVGIGGIGMSGIAEVLLTLGYKVSGSDLKESPITARLQELGAVICAGHRAENVSDAEVVVTSAAIARDNPEVVEAHARRIAIIQRAEMLAELMRLKYGIAVAGMHGKTTTTSMVAAILAAGRLDPTVVVGGRVDALGSNARLGKSHYLVAEADESDRSFLKLSPIISVVTNIDREHMDAYRDMADVEETFIRFLDRLPFYGMAVVCNDDERVRGLMPRLARRAVTYGLRPDSDFRIHMLTTPAASGQEAAANQDAGAKGATSADAQESGERGPARAYSRFSVEYRGRSLGEFALFVPGMHNVLNATAAIAVGIGLDIAPADIRAALHEFHGVDRRFQLKGKAAGVTVVDDYGHHPTEIRATLAAARQCGFARVHVIFQPHRHTRTRDLMSEFTAAFDDADALSVLDIYAASEPPIPGITGEALAASINRNGRAAHYAPSFQDAVDAVCQEAKPGDLIITLGAGNVSQLGAMVIEGLREKEKGPQI